MLKRVGFPMWVYGLHCLLCASACLCIFYGLRQPYSIIVYTSQTVSSMLTCFERISRTLRCLIYIGRAQTECTQTHIPRSVLSSSVISCSSLHLWWRRKPFRRSHRHCVTSYIGCSEFAFLKCVPLHSDQTPSSRCPEYKTKRDGHK